MLQNAYNQRRQVEDLVEQQAAGTASLAALETEVPLTVKQYVGIITKAADTTTPTVTALHNTTGTTITASYGGVGSYRLKFASSVLTASKTLLLIGSPGGIQKILKIERTSATLATVTSASGTTGKGFGSVLNQILTKVPFEIRVYA